MPHDIWATLSIADLGPGKELAYHQRLTLATDVEVYFCDPRSPWQRGLNENTDRLLRQYLSCGTELSVRAIFSSDCCPEQR